MADELSDIFLQLIENLIEFITYFVLAFVRLFSGNSAESGDFFTKAFRMVLSMIQEAAQQIGDMVWNLVKAIPNLSDFIEVMCQGV